MFGAGYNYEPGGSNLMGVKIMGFFEPVAMGAFDHHLVSGLFSIMVLRYILLTPNLRDLKILTFVDTRLACRVVQGSSASVRHDLTVLT